MLHRLVHVLSSWVGRFGVSTYFQFCNLRVKNHCCTEKLLWYCLVLDVYLWVLRVAINFCMQKLGMSNRYCYMVSNLLDMRVMKIAKCCFLRVLLPPAVSAIFPAIGTRASPMNPNTIANVISVWTATNHAKTQI